MKLAEFRNTLTQQLLIRLKPLNFQMIGSESFVRRKDSHEINVIWIQKHTSKPMVCVNLGVHYDFSPKIGKNDTANNSDIEQPDCEIKRRLTPNELQSDYWWSFGMVEVKEIVNLITTQALPYFDSYELKGEIGSITPSQFEGDLPDLFSDLTKVRACLLMARIYEAKGETNMAAAFSRLGIKVAGMAVGPKKALKEILIRTE